MRTHHKLPLLFLLLSTCSLGQLPTISPGGIVNAASGLNSDPGHYGLVPGSLASIYGTNLAQGTQAAQGTPLPYSLLGTSVTVAGIPAPLLFVSPTQINFQVPHRVDYSQIEGLTQPSPVIVTAPAGASPAVNIQAAAYGSGLFTANGGACGPGAIQNVTSSGAVSLNSPSNSVEPGQFVTIYGTGLGITPQNTSDGVPAPSNPPTSVEPVELQAVGAVGGSLIGASFTGLAPGLVGVDQANVRLPNPVREGCTVPLSLSVSPPVTISIHRGGGACVDPPAAADGTVLLQRVTTSGTVNEGTVETLDATFTQSPGRTVSAPSAPYGLSNGNAGPRFNLPFPNCPIPGYIQLSAGPLTLTTLSSVIGGITAPAGASYDAVLPAGTLQAGSFTVSSNAPGAVGLFQAGIAFGKDIQVLSPLPAVGSTFSTDGIIRPTWSGGDPNSVVTVSLISHYAQTQNYVSCQAPASAGTCTWPFSDYMKSFFTPLPGSKYGELVFQVDPDPASPTRFSAPGLSLGGQATWQIQHSFQGFAIR